MSAEKLERVLELLEELTEIYPEMDKVLMNDSDEPDYIIITTEPFLKEMANSFGISDEIQKDLGEFYSSPKSTKNKKLQ